MNAIFLRMRMKCTDVGETLKGGAARRTLRRLVRDERAVSVIEYAILLGVIVGATTLAVANFGDQIGAAINTISNNVTNTVSSVGTSTS